MIYILLFYSMNNRGGFFMLTAHKQDHPLAKDFTDKIDGILTAHDNDPTQIVNILLDVQDLTELHYVPEPAAYYIAQKIGVKITTIYDCLTFYSSLSEHPRAKYPIQICNSIVCRVNDSDSVFSHLKELLGIDIGEVTYDGRFTLESVPCFGACDQAPAIRINGKVYGHLDSHQKVLQLLDTFI